MNISENRGAFTVGEFCEWSRMGRTRFYEEVNSRRLRTRKLGTKTLVTVADAQAWLDALPVQEMEAA